MGVAPTTETEPSTLVILPVLQKIPLWAFGSLTKMPPEKNLC